ncbi:MAG: BatD family protein [candidate division KSB1 bacterium]|nr:BatD family protein [candidate division KSB1 bacterium]
MRASATSDQIPLNRLVTFTIELKWQGRLSDIEIDPLETPQLSNFKVVGSSSSNWVGLENGEPTSITTFADALKPEGLGMGYLEKMGVSYLEKATGERLTLSTERIGIEITDPVPEPGQAPLGMALAVGLLICAALAVLVFQIEARAKQKEAARLAAMAEKPMEEEFLSELKSAIDINTTETKEAFVAISRLLRRYLSRRYDIPAQGISTTEVVAALRKNAAAEEHIPAIEEILQTCDLFKFSGEAGDPSRLARTFALTENLLEMNRRNDAR